VEWGAPPDFLLKPHLLRWSLESLFIASHELFESEELLRALGVHSSLDETTSKLHAYLQACHPQSPADCPADEFCDRWQRPQKCLDGLVSAVGAGSLAKRDKRRDELIRLATKGDRLEELFIRVPDLYEAAQTLVNMVQDESANR
jgi:hypothetical protein